MKVLTRTTYIADDGTEFDTEKECVEYEREQEALEDFRKYYIVRYNPDTGEGRRLFNSTVYLQVTSNHRVNHTSAVHDLLYEKLGKKAAYFYGKSEHPMDVWTVESVTKEQFLTSKSKIIAVQEGTNGLRVTEVIGIIDSRGKWEDLA